MPQMNILDIAEVIMGQSPSGEFCNTSGEGIPLLNGPTEFGFKYPTPVQYTTKPKKIAKPGDLLFCVRGSVGRMNYADREYAIGRGLASFRSKFSREHTRLIEYLIRLSLGSILQSATGSTFPNVSKEQIYSWSWDLPPIEQQMRIVEILGSLDDKIELNRRMNETLEQMAMALYKYWFVDFGPFSDIDENGLPIGWRWGTLEEIGYTYKDQVDPTELDYQLPYIGLEHMPKGSISLEEWEYSDKVSSNKFLFDKGDILFGKLRPYFKKVGVAPVNGVCSTDILVIRPKSDVFFGLLFAQVIQDEFIDYCSNTSNGTKMPRCDWNQMAKFKLPIPSDSVLIDFNKKIKSFVEQVISNIHENRMLIEIRDFLLPRLLSGEIEVREAEEQVEEVLANA